MDAARIKAARHRLWRAWLFGGLLWSVFLLGVARLFIWLVGIERAETVQFALVVALVLAGGMYSVFYFGAVIALIGKRIIRREPIMDRD